MLRVLRWSSRLLPADIRERVFEPALADFLLDDDEAQLPASQRWRVRLFAGLVLAVESFRLGLPTYFWRRGRVTRLGKAVAVILVSSTVIVVLLTNIQYGPGAGPLP